MNKVTGLVLFLWPLTISFAESEHIAITVCFVATISAIQEGVYAITDSAPRQDASAMSNSLMQVALYRVKQDKSPAAFCGRA